MGLDFAFVVVSCWCASLFVNHETETVTFKELQLEICPNEDIDLDDLPDRISALDGKRIRIRGYIYGPSMATTQESKFMLVRDTMEFAPWPEWHNIAVTMERGNDIEFTVRPVTIVGTFKVGKRTKRSEGELPTYFQMLDASVSSE